MFLLFLGVAVPFVVAICGMDRLPDFAASIVLFNPRKTTLRRTTAFPRRRGGERIGLERAELARASVKNNARDSLPTRRSNSPMTKMILRLAPTEYFAVDTVLVVTLAVAAGLNAWCLSAYL